MTYNRFLYNTALYNAGREEVGAVARSLIQAHTGPHIQAVVGLNGGLSFISDFNVITGSTPLPTSFNFPDLKALIRAVQVGTDDLGASIVGWGELDLPACIFPVDHIPDLSAFIKSFESEDLPAIISGFLAEANLPATIFVAITDLSAIMTGVISPILRARINVQPPGNLGAIITGTPVPPVDLGAILNILSQDDLGGSIFGNPSGNLRAKIGPTAFDPDLSAFIRREDPSSGDLGGFIDSNLNAIPDHLRATINGSGGFQNLPTFIRTTTAAVANLKATVGIVTGNTFDLQAIIDFLAGKDLGAAISGFSLNGANPFLPATITGWYASSLPAYLNVSGGFVGLPAFIEALADRADLAATIRVAETFVTAIVTVSTLASRDLKASLGVHECAGGSGILDLSASATPQFAKDLRARITSFVTSDLGARISSGGTGIYVYDAIDIFYTTFRPRLSTRLKVTDTINVVYGPFRGQNLGAIIASQPLSVNLSAALNPVLPLLRVAPTVSRITAMELTNREALNIQEVRLQLEGALTEFFYVNGTDEAFIRDVNERWVINIRSFRPLAANLLGEFAAERICRIGSLESYENLDQAIRACISYVIGDTTQTDLGATISVAGGFSNLRARMGITNNFKDLGALTNTVFPADLASVVASIGTFVTLSSRIMGVAEETEDLGAIIGDGTPGGIIPGSDDGDLIASITGI